jgi:signal transduction histidine kinase
MPYVQAESSTGMNQITKIFRAIPQTTLRRLRNTPSYFFLLWRWVAWLLALITVVADASYRSSWLAILLLVITFLQTLVVTLYAPVFQILLPGLPRTKRVRAPRQHRRRRLWKSGQLEPLATDEEPDLLTPLARTRKPYWDAAIYSADVVICGLVTYFGGYFGVPHFGVGSPFYRYGISTALAAALTYRYRGGLAAAIGYDLFVLLGAFFPPTQVPYDPLNARDLVSSLLDAPLIAILAAYIASLLESYTRSKRREQDNVRLQKAFRYVSETLIRDVGDRQNFLKQSAERIRKGGHFERLILALVHYEDGEENSKRVAKIDTCVEAGFVESSLPDKSRVVLEQVLQTREQYNSFDRLSGLMVEERYGMARLYVPVFKDKQVYLILGAESTRLTPFEHKQEEFISTLGPQLVVALENIRLTERTVELAAIAERGRIAREIHDGVAQLVYMLSLNTETCAALAHRIAETSNEEQEALTPLAAQLDKLVTISKQALWETRHYMFTLKPLMSGNSTLTQMLGNQLSEFETISGLPVQLEVEGNEEAMKIDGDAYKARKIAQVGTAIFRITQEALTNAYKHAEATRLQVHVRYLPHAVEVEIEDNGKGLAVVPSRSRLRREGEQQRIYSGHGMSGMRERAAELGGTFEVKQQATGGVSVKANIPI